MPWYFQEEGESKGQDQCQFRVRVSGGRAKGRTVNISFKVVSIEMCYLIMHPNQASYQGRI